MIKVLRKCAFGVYANSEGPDQPAQLSGLISLDKGSIQINIFLISPWKHFMGTQKHLGKVLLISTRYIFLCSKRKNVEIRKI